MSERGEATRDRLLDAAALLFSRHGYAAVSVDAICAAAQVRKGSFYHAFASKEGLVVATIERTWQVNRREIVQSYASDLPLEDQFRHHLEWFGLSQRRLKAKCGFVPGPLNIALDIGVPAAVVELNRRFVADHREILRSAIGRLLTPRGHGPALIDWMTDVVQGLINGANIGARLSNSLAPFDLLPETVMALMQLTPPPVAGVVGDWRPLGRPNNIEVDQSV
jgi:TetR/AcrR family transcriptional repressor of nem operon